jgi:hypothetical protein
VPLILYAADGVTETWNTNNVGGGVVAAVKFYDIGATDTLNFPAFAGRTVTLINLLLWATSVDPGWTVDYNQGFPRVTVNATSRPKRLAVVVM